MISFCIPAHNEESLLPATLAAIHDAARALSLEYEIVVADDASTDSTRAMAAAAGARVVPIEARQISAARNAAARAARGHTLFFIDADTLVNADAVREGLEAMRDGAIGGGALVRFDGENNPRWVGPAAAIFLRVCRATRFTGGACLFCRRDAFDAVGGFDETLFASEEVFFNKALKQRGRWTLISTLVTTSGRKLRTYTAREIFVAIFRIGLRGVRGVQDRELLGIWYDSRREDPEHRARPDAPVPAEPR